jgi:hypothetical protein
MGLHGLYRDYFTFLFLPLPPPLTLRTPHFAHGFRGFVEKDLLNKLSVTEYVVT